MVYTEELFFAYQNGKKLTYPSIQCRIGCPLLISGRSGCGKSTLLHILGGLITDYHGKVSINSTLISALGNVALDKFRGQHIGIIFQNPHFVGCLNMLDNINLAAYLGSGKKNNEKAKKLITTLDIGHLQHKMPNQLSNGELQRFSIARALINDVALVLADEPTSSLDDDNVATVVTLLQQQTLQANAAMVIVTHDDRLKKHFTNKIHLQ